MDELTSASNLLLVFVTLLLVYVAYLQKKATDIQFVSSIAIAFQDDWHRRSSILMRAALQYEMFKDAFNKAIEEAYGKHICYLNILELLDEKSLIGNISNQDRLEVFHNRLMNIIFYDSIRIGEPLFSGYEALYRVLLCFDRLAFIRNSRQAFTKFIRNYKPPLRDFTDILQAFISVRILLRKDEDKNYKKDYMQLLHMLKLDNPDLYKTCKGGLKNRKPKEWNFWDTLRASPRYFKIIILFRIIAIIIISALIWRGWICFLM